MPGAAAKNFGRYQLLDRIASGGMAEIWLARYVAAAGVTKQVVIKRILPGYEDNAAFVSMFINEAKIAATLSHGNVAQIFDFGEVDGEYFLAMEYVHGQSLSKLISKAREEGLAIPLPIAVYVVAQVCNGLHYAHSRLDERGAPLGIVHRDVSPQNVLVSYEGEVKVVDFGIAKMASAREKETQRGAVKGKYAYFSPEQARGASPDGRSDLFAAGIMLYELLVGRRPFEGKMLEVLSAIAKAEFLPPSLLNPCVPKELEAIVMKAMALRPEDRYQTGLEMHDALQLHLHLLEPRFTAAWLSHFARFLGREEMEGQGIQTGVPSEFLEELERWSTSVPEHAEGPVRQTLQTEAVVVGKRRGSRGTGKGKGLAVALAAAGVGLGSLVALGLVLLRGGPSFSVEVSSSPPGAAIHVDGRDSGRVTPGAIEGLSAEAKHLVELRLPDRLPYRIVVEPPPGGGRASVQAVWESEGPPPESDLPGDGRAPLELPLAPGPALAPPESELGLPAILATSIPASRAARLRLDPTRRYRLEVEGFASLGPGAGDSPLRGVFFFVERANGTPVEGSYGWLDSGEAPVVEGARALYAFLLDTAPFDNSGALKVAVTDVASKRSERLLVDARENAIEPGEHLARANGLAPESAYRASVVGAVSLGAEGGRTSRVLYFAEAEPGVPVGGVGQGAFSDSEPAALEGARAVWFLLPDDDALDNEGTLTLSLSSAGVAVRD